MLDTWLADPPGAAPAAPVDASDVARGEDSAGAPGEGGAGVATGDGETAPEALPVFDRVGLLERVMDDEELLASVVTSFLRELPQLVAHIDGALASADGQGLAHHAHTLKGSAATIGGVALAAVAAAVEQHARAEQLEAARALRPALAREAARLAAVLQERPPDGTA